MWVVGMAAKPPCVGFDEPHLVSDFHRHTAFGGVTLHEGHNAQALASWHSLFICCLLANH
jgi:hypothetical protein